MIQDKGYYDFGDFLREHFTEKVQKISINAGFTCPNRDGSKGTGGCTYCNNRTFNPDYCKPVLSITEQLEKGKEFFAGKYPGMKYLAYFQAYTNTYADINSLISMYGEALTVTDVVGIIIGTRPDCMPDELLEYLSGLSRRCFVLVEYGVETSNNATLGVINRGHTWEDTVDAVSRTAGMGVMCGIHIILGLPGEGREEILATADAVSSLPVRTIKLHQLQVIRGTRLASQIEKGEVSVMKWNVDDYIDICMAFIARLSPAIAIERFVSQSPDSLLVFPRWGLKNYEFTNLLNSRIKKAGIYQGCGIPADINKD